MRRNFPHLHPRLILRPRLLALLDEGRSSRILTVTAPAGYGKTTLGAMWLQRLNEARKAPDAVIPLWLTCTNEDNDSVCIARDILQAIATCVPGLDEVLVGIRTMPGAAPQLFESAIRSFADLPRDIFLALDDLHLIHASDSLRILQTLIGAAPPNLHLLLISRIAPNLQMPQTTLHLSANDLRFDHAEFMQYVLSSTRLADLDDAVLATLEQRAEGWVTALQLFNIAPNNSLRKVESTDVLPLRRDFIDEYFERFVLRSQPEPMRRFLLHTAALPAFDASLAALTLDISITESIAFIDAALKDNLFLQEYEGADQMRAFTYHPLFREFLERSFFDEYDRPTFETHLTRLGDIFKDRNDVDAALDFYLRAGAVTRALQLLVAHIRTAMRTGETVPALRWMARFTDEQIESVPTLALDAAWLAQIVGDASRRPALERARRALAHDPIDPEQHTALLTLEALTCYFEGKPDDARRFTDEACARATPNDPLIAGYRSCARALSPLDASDWQARVAVLGDAVDYFRQADFPYGMIYASAMRAATQRRFADGAGTLHSLTILMRNLGDRLDNYSGSLLDARTVYAETLYMIDQLEEAQNQFSIVLDTSIRIPEMEFSLQKASIYLDTLQAIHGTPPQIEPDADIAAWRRALSALSPIAIGSLAHQRVIRDFLCGNLEASRTMLDIAGIDRTSPVDIARLAALSYDILSGNADPTVGDALAEMLAASRAPSQRLALMRIAAPYAIYLDAIGRTTHSEDILREILPLVRESRMHRIILDYAPIGAILQRIHDPFAQRLYLRLHSNAAPFNLSQAELRVLQLTAKGLRRREIAQHINRQPITVGRHLIHAYRKLGVHSRADALRILREIGIID